MSETTLFAVLIIAIAATLIGCAWAIAWCIVRADATPPQFQSVHTHRRIYTCPRCYWQIPGEPCTPDHHENQPAREPP